MDETATSSTAAGWYQDPGAPQQWRWWDGQRWTDQTAPLTPNGTTVASHDVAGAVPPAVPAPEPGAEISEGPAPATERLEPLGDPGAMIADDPVEPLPAAALPEGALWQGSKTAVAGPVVSTVTYTLYPDMLRWSRGRLSTRSEQLPLVAIHDIDVHQSLLQKSRDLGNVTLHLIQGDASRTRMGADRASMVIDSVPHPYELRDLIMLRLRELKEEARIKERTQHYSFDASPSAAVAPAPVPTGALPQAHTPPSPPAAPAEAAGAAPTMIAAELKALAELRDAGVLTEEEFQAQKAALLGR